VAEVTQLKLIEIQRTASNLVTNHHDTQTEKFVANKCNRPT